MFESIRIVKEEDLEYARQYTDLGYINYIEWNYSKSNATRVIKYVKDVMLDRKELFLYNTWLDDKSPVVLRSKKLEEIDEDDIKNIWGKGYFEKNECLKIYRW